MSRYIDADALQEAYMNAFTSDIDGIEKHGYWSSFVVRQIVNDMPTADVVEVVRCKDCDWFIVNEIKADGTTDKRYKPTWCTYHNGYMNDDDFCSYGERREDDKR